MGIDGGFFDGGWTDWLVACGGGDCRRVMLLLLSYVRDYRKHGIVQV
jgi:hypothetical protein